MEVIVQTQWEYCAIVSVLPTPDGWLVGKTYKHPSNQNIISSLLKFSFGSRTIFRSEDPYSLSEKISELGTNGWELVSVDQGVMYFKRPKYEKYNIS